MFALLSTTWKIFAVGKIEVLFKILFFFILFKPLEVWSFMV